MLHVMLAEDSPTDTRTISAYLARFCADEGVELDLKACRNGRELCESFNDEVDLLLLDIEMPEMDGITAARRIRRTNEEVPICFLTNLDAFALEGYSVNALGYLVKPVSYPSFRQMLKRTLALMERRRPRLVQLKTGKEERFVDIRKIIYVETQRKMTYVHLDHGGFVCTDTMKAIEGKLAGSPFFRIHNAFLVNLAYVESVSSDEVTIQGNQLPISKYRKQSFFEALAEFVNGTR